MTAYIEVHCQCGKTLRAREEQAGGTVRCWSCHTDVTVPRRGLQKKLLRDSIRGARAVWAAETLLLIVAWGIGMALALSIPWAGSVLAFLLAAYAGVRYCLRIWRGDTLSPAPFNPDASPAARWRSRVRWGLAGAFGALGLLCPFIVRHGVMDGLGLGARFGSVLIHPLAAVCWLLVPLILFAVAAGDGDRRLGVRRALAAATRHPLGTVLSLLIFPLGMVLLELGVIAVAWQQVWLGGFVSDLFPEPTAVRYHPVRMHYGAVDSTNMPDFQIFDLYRGALRKGYTLTGALPASLVRGYHTRFGMGKMNVEPPVYLAVRGIFTALIFMAIGALLAIQSSWLGLIARAGTRGKT